MNAATVMAPVSCPALLIAAPASGQGKTLVTAALARLHTALGRKVRVFKCGPDFIDIQLHRFASKAPVHNLDLGMTGAADIRWRLYEAARSADLILIEGVMGLYDGQPSTADLARRFGIPVLAVIDAQAMAQTFGAIARGLATHVAGLPFAGVLANQLGSEGHGELLRAALPPSIRWFGGLLRDPAAALPERHLGLVQAEEMEDVGARLDRLGAQLRHAPASALPPAVKFAPGLPPAVKACWQGYRIGVAHDAAFSFIYPANIELLRALGAELQFFSPLGGDELPAGCDALWLPGGYPELHAAQLAVQRRLWVQLREFVAAGRPVLAEGGGLICLCAELVDGNGVRHVLSGVLPGTARMQSRLAGLGMQQLELDAGVLRGHSFHYGVVETALAPALHARHDDGRKGEAVYRQRALTASFFHGWFPSAPAAVAALFAAQPEAAATL